MCTARRSAPDGTRIASGGADKTLRLWTTYPDPTSAMCATLTTNMSGQQWRAEAVIQLQDQQLSAIKVVNLALKATRRSATAKKIRAAMHFANRGFVTACCFRQTLLGISLLRWRKREK